MSNACPVDVDYTRGLGGSQIAAAVGLNPYCPPIQLWCELVGEAEGFEGNRFTKWGKLLEEPIRQEYAERHGVVVEVPEPIVDGWKRARPDGLVYEYDLREQLLSGRQCLNPRPDRGLEVKTGDKYTTDRWGEPETDEIPIEYLCQDTWYMHVTDLPRWDTAVLLGGNDYREYILERDRDFERSLVARASHFWHHHVLKRIPPEPDGSDEYRDWIGRRYPHVTDDYVEADEVADQMAVQLRDVVREIKSLERVESKLWNELLSRIGDASGMVTSVGKITYRPVKGKAKTDWEAIARELADRLGLSTRERLQLTADNTARGKGYRARRRPNAWTKEID
jgi:putative phage-type endonuclease